MFNLKEYKERADRLADRLVWARLVAPGVVEQKDGLLQQTIAFRGPDLDSATPSGLVQVTASLNNVLRRLGDGWSIFVEAQRSIASDYVMGVYEDPLSELIDLERRAQFQKGAHYESRFFLTIVFSPPKKTKAKMADLLFEGGADQASGSEGYLEQFREQVDAVAGLMNGICPYVEVLDDDQTLTYLHSTISTRWHNVKCPEIPVYLDAQLADESLEVGTELKLGQKFLRTLTIRSFPGSTVPGILDGLNNLKFEYRWMSRYICYSKQTATTELNKYRRRWYRKRQGLGSMVSEMAGGSGSALQNSDAVIKANDADVALQEVGSDQVSFGLFTATVTVWGDTREEAQERLKEAERAIHERGFVVIRETFNTLQAWLSSHPGNVYANVRRPLVNSLNLAHMIPMSAVWSGSRINSHLGGPAHLTADTTASTPFRLSTNVGDVGHTLMLGRTGGGKSAFLALMMAQWLKYPNSRVIGFDKGRSARALCLGVGGSFFDLDLAGSNLKFQPLARVDEEGERAWARDWLVEILVTEGLEVGPSEKQLLWDALGPTGVAGMPVAQRTMFALKNTVQNTQIRQVIGQYCLGGVYGELFDGDHETLSTSRFIIFEMEKLMETKGAVGPALSYLFHRVEDLFTGVPTLLVLDEAWTFLDHPMFAAKIREWLKVLRKKRVYVIFATQSIADAVESSISPVLFESCVTQIFLPDEKAVDPQMVGYYRRMGLNRQQIKLLSVATPKRHYYVRNARGNRLFEINLRETPVAFAFCTASDPDAQKLIDEVKREAPRAFAERWLERNGQGAAAAQISQLRGRNSMSGEPVFGDATLVDRDLFDKAYEEGI